MDRPATATRPTTMRLEEVSRKRTRSCLTNPLRLLKRLEQQRRTIRGKGSADVHIAGDPAEMHEHTPVADGGEIVDSVGRHDCGSALRPHCSQLFGEPG